MREIPIPRIHGPRLEELRERFIVPETPVILDGWARTWPAREKWHCQYLQDTLGELELPAIESARGVFPDFSPGAVVRPVSVGLSRYLDAIWAGDEWARTRLVNGDTTAILQDGGQRHERFGALFEDIELPPWIDRQALHYIGLWLSGGGVVSWLHYDNNGMHNFNVQVKGRKRVFLISPAQSPSVYPHLFTEHGPGNSQFSRVDVHDPDLDRFPAFRNAQVMSAVLEEGDAVFFPAYWYHSFRHLEQVNINVNFWWRPGRHLLNAITVRRRFWAALARTLSPDGARPQARAVAAAIEALPAETRALLQALEAQLLDPKGLTKQ